MRRRYRSMGYVYQRNSGIYELRYPIPKTLQPYFPKPSGKGFRSHHIEGLGTRDANQANARAQERIQTLQSLFDYLEGGDLTHAIQRPLRAEFEGWLSRDSEQRLEDDLSEPNVLLSAESIQPLVQALQSSDPGELRAVAGYLVQPALDALGTNGLSVPDATPVYNRVLQLCADVLLDAHRARLARSKGLAEPAPKATILQAEPPRDPADGVALSSAGKKTVADYWNVSRHPPRTCAQVIGSGRDSGTHNLRIFS